MFMHISQKKSQLFLLYVYTVGSGFPVDHFMGFVHVEDVALAHILVYENKSATGRHLCIESASHFSDFANKIAELYPEYKLPRYAYISFLHHFSDPLLVDGYLCI